MSDDSIQLRGVGVEIAGNAEQIGTKIMSMTQQGEVPAFWCPKRTIRKLPPGVRPWSIWDKKPEIAMVLYDKKMLSQNKIKLQYRDTTVITLMLDDFARCGTIVIDRTTITQVWTIRSPGQRDFLGQDHRD